ncbi:hypothetical protein PpBr36_08572 [Pyricularia pennisetigena]|uniref:hypothetical protein n=1 Tax=Pyricularia pennisetigena TaxID=1578925 RepID=UPI00114FA26E|nr:hypothetical protein PpBr36_08572 [Pyricularia pennisetigena]TLS23848.1 hypothetical protein PpBr36_08572 [Pyricularia pennisetigena]
MDPNLLRHMEYFTVPNAQTSNAAERAANLTRSSGTGQPYPLWNPSTLGADIDFSFNPQGLEGLGSFGAFEQSQDQNNSGTAFEPPQRQRSIYTQGPRTLVPTRTLKPPSREKPERKRSKLSTDSTPFDSVDYWLQFDNEGTIPEETGAEASASATTQGEPAVKPTAQEPQRSRQLSNWSSRSHKQKRQGEAQAASQSGSRTRQVKVEDSLDDSALDNALSDDEQTFASMSLAEQLSKIDSTAPTEVPQRESLFSTPLSWERPQPGLRMDSVMSTQSRSTLDQAEQRRLIAIAMNRGTTSGGLGSSMADQYSQYQTDFESAMSGFGLGTASMSQLLSMPPPNIVPPKQPQPQRPDKGKEKAGAKGDRTAHNDIERKYRTNLKDKIAELRDAVPALRTIPENEVDGEDVGQPSRGPKVSKGAVLTKATEYIHYLEKKNKMIVQQHQELSKRLQAFEQLLSATARPTYQMPNYSRTLFDPRAFC